MSKEERTAWLALPVILLVAAGLAWAGSQGGARWNGMPVFALSVALAFFLNWAAFIPAWLQHTERFFDLMGGVTFLTVSVAAVALSPVRDARSWLLVLMVAVWAVRLSTFLYRRVHAAGEDRRFREIKVSFPRFLLTWTLQGLWVAISLAPALAAITGEKRLPLDVFALSGSLVWAAGFAIEVVADAQKSRFKANPANAGRFIHSGLWAWSRHPNYFGEIVLWIGVALVAAPALQGWQWITLISPVFIILLLTRVSGVPMLEARADEKWGGQPDYEAYKANTPVLIPRPPRSP
ncbi:MAG: DUF1295 domain-containing protein [Caldilineae bacterium]|nr:MAG: DUF1295 domain-containing protein [Caldilineae bacterium]